MAWPLGPISEALGLVGRFRHHGDDREAGGAAPVAEGHRARRLDDEAVEVGRGAVAGEEDRGGGARCGAEAADHVEGCTGVPCRGRVDVALAEAGRLKVGAQDADCVEGTAHPQFDVAAGAGVDLAGHCDVAAVAGDVTFGRVARQARCLVVADPVVEHVAGVLCGGGRHGRILDDRTDTRHRSVVVDRGQPIGGRRDEGR